MKAAFDFSGKSVLVTGASRGIGFGVAEAFAMAGADLTSTIDGTPGWSGTPTPTDAANGVCTVDVPKTATANFAPGVYLADVQVVAGGKTRTAAVFQFRVNADVTRS